MVQMLLPSDHSQSPTNPGAWVSLPPTSLAPCSVRPSVFPSAAHPATLPAFLYVVAMSLIRAPTSWSWSGELKAGMDGVVEGVQGAWAREHKGGIDSSLLSTWLRGRINSPLNNALVPFSDIISLWSFLPSRCIPLRSGRQISPPRCEIFSLGYSHIFYSSPLN